MFHKLNEFWVRRYGKDLVLICTNCSLQSKLVRGINKHYYELFGVVVVIHFIPCKSLSALMNHSTNEMHNKGIFIVIHERVYSYSSVSTENWFQDSAHFKT
jgi:hypothetical protein